MKNMGRFDRIARIVFGGSLVGLAITGTTAWGWLGLVPLGTALVGWCPLYTLFGWRTCPVGQK
jgi:hypothetical protein